ncbi:MAG: hypothetical protein AB7G11_04670 [Phycisphaerales bacterium]
MRYRHWLLVTAASIFVFAVAELKVPLLARNLTHYGEGEFRATVLAAIAGLFAWVILEATHHVVAARARAPRCSCGYSLAGVRCPECGRQLGDPPTPPRPHP